MWYNCCKHKYLTNYGSVNCSINENLYFHNCCYWPDSKSVWTCCCSDDNLLHCSDMYAKWSTTAIPMNGHTLYPSIRLNEHILGPGMCSGQTKRLVINRLKGGFPAQVEGQSGKQPGHRVPFEWEHWTLQCRTK